MVLRLRVRNLGSDRSSSSLNVRSGAGGLGVYVSSKGSGYQQNSTNQN
jgi:hypothetical protein